VRTSSINALLNRANEKIEIRIQEKGDTKKDYDGALQSNKQRDTTHLISWQQKEERLGGMGSMSIYIVFRERIALIAEESHINTITQKGGKKIP